MSLADIEKPVFTTKALISLCVENDLLIMRALACLVGDANLPSIEEKLQERTRRLRQLLDTIADEIEAEE